MFEFALARTDVLMIEQGGVMRKRIGRAFAPFLVCVLASACGSAQGINLAGVPSGYQLIGEFAPTFYRTLDESSGEWPDEERTEELRAQGGELIARVTPSFKE